MNRNTARAVHWLASGRSAAVVAPAVRLATAPATMGRLRQLGEVMGDIDLDRARMIAERLRTDREFQRSVVTAAGRVQRAAQPPSRRRGRLLWMLAAIGVAGALLAAKSRVRRGACGARRTADEPAAGRPVDADFATTAGVR